MRKASFCALALLVIVLLSACSSQKRNIEKTKVDMAGIRIALASYAKHDGRYPTTEQGLQALVTKPTLPPEPASWEGPYLKPEQLLDTWGNKYVYRYYPERRRKYDLCSYGPDGKESGDDVIGRSSEEQ